MRQAQLLTGADAMPTAQTVQDGQLAHADSKWGYPALTTKARGWSEGVARGGRRSEGQGENQMVHGDPPRGILPRPLPLRGPIWDSVRLFTTGKVLWRNRELKYPPNHGNGSSPILVDGAIVFSCDGSRDPFLAALEADTGKLRWKSPRKLTGREPRTCTGSTALLPGSLPQMRITWMISAKGTPGCLNVLAI